MTAEDWRDIIYILQFGITPEGGMGRADLPVGVDTWLLPVQAAIGRAGQEASEK